MRHGRRRGRLGLVQEHRRALLRNLAKSLITHQQIVTTHAKAKEASRFVDQLVTMAKQNTLHSRRLLIQELGSGSEDFAKKMIQKVAPTFNGRKGGYTRVLRYKNRPGDGATLALLEFTVPIEIGEKKPKKEKKPKTEHEKRKEEHREKSRASEEAKTKKEEPSIKKETPKKGGFLNTLRRFLKGDDENKK